MPSPEKKAILKRISQTGIVPEFYHDDPEVCKNVLKACYEAGVRVIEYLDNAPRIQENYIVLKKFVQKELPDLYFGIGNVKEMDMARKALDFNADFLVGSIINPEVGHLCKERNVLWIPGCATPTEINTAWKASATLIKLFPAEALGMPFLRSVKHIFPDMQFLPSGGVLPNAANIIPWLESGATAVNLGHHLISEEMLALNDFSYLQAHLRRLLKTVRQWRRQSIA